MSGHPVAIVEAERLVVAGQRALLDLQFQLDRLAAGDLEPLVAQLVGRVLVGRVGEVWWRAQQRCWSATSRPWQWTWTRSRSATSSTRRPITPGWTQWSLLSNRR
jgi:hypothetical protein